MQAESVFQALQQGILICDRNARILYFNEAYGELIGVSLESAKGKLVTDYRAHALVPSVILTGQPVEGVVRREGSQTYYASVYPILEDGTLRGSVSIVTTLAQHKLKVSHTELTLEERVQQFERKEIEAEISLYGESMEGKRKAAKALGISLATLYNKRKEQ